MTTKSEDVLLQMGGVRYKKGDGTLYVMNERIAWMAENRDKVAVAHRFQDIKSKANISRYMALTSQAFTQKHSQNKSKYLHTRLSICSAKNLTGRQAESATTGGFTRQQQYHISFCQSQWHGGPNTGS